MQKKVNLRYKQQTSPENQEPFTPQKKQTKTDEHFGVNPLLYSPSDQHM